MGCRRIDFEGSEVRTFSYPASQLMKDIRKNKVHFNRKFIGIGNMDENWGWLSTHFLNRTASWAFNFELKLGPFSPVTQMDEVQSFLDNPNLIMLLVNQHHNISHPKVISLPRGMLQDKAKIIFDEAQRAIRMDTHKDTLMFAASSTWGVRPLILDCVKDKMGKCLCQYIKC
jgi:hypothetical protein